MQVSSDLKIEEEIPHIGQAGHIIYVIFFLFCQQNVSNAGAYGLFLPFLWVFFQLVVRGGNRRLMQDIGGVPHFYHYDLRIAISSTCLMFLSFIYFSLLLPS